MSCVRFKLNTGGEVALSAATKKTVLQLRAAANHAVKADEISVSFDGVSNTAEPVLVEIVRQTTDGTGTSQNPVKDPDDSDETLQVTGFKNFTVEPTEGDVLMQEKVHPQSGYTWQAPFGREIKVGGGDRLAVACTAAAAVNVVARINGEE